MRIASGQRWAKAGLGPVTPATGGAHLAMKAVAVGRVSEIPDGEVRGIEVGGREISLCRLGEEVFALSGACSYHPIPLHGAHLEGEVLTCPWYGAQYDVRTGESVFLRAARPLATYPTTVRGGRVYVQVPLTTDESPVSRWVGVER